MYLPAPTFLLVSPMTTDPSSPAAGSTTRVRVPDGTFRHLVSAAHGVMMQSCNSDLSVCQCNGAESKKKKKEQLADR